MPCVNGELLGVNKLQYSLEWRHNEHSVVYSDADQSKHQSSASLAFVRGIHRWPVNSPHKGPVARKMFQFDDVIMRVADLLPSSTVPIAISDVYSLL